MIPNGQVSIAWRGQYGDPFNFGQLVQDLEIDEDNPILVVLYLTVLSSLNLILLVSETPVSLSNYTYLLTVLSSLKLPLLVSGTPILFSNYTYL